MHWDKRAADTQAYRQVDHGLSSGGDRVTGQKEMIHTGRALAARSPTQSIDNSASKITVQNVHFAR